MRTSPARPACVRATALLVAGAALSAALTGCGRKVSENDCRDVAEHLGQVWASEAHKEETEGPGKEKADAVIRQEGERFKRDWSEDCKKELVGKRVEDRDLSCLLGTKTMADIQKCADQ